MKTYFERAKEMYDDMAKGKLLETFDKNYHQDVVQIEANGDTRKGKAANREFQVKFLNDIKEVHGAGIHSIASNENEKITFVESWMDITMKDGKRQKMEEVAVQHWLGEQIIHERFYYNSQM